MGSEQKFKEVNGLDINIQEKLEELNQRVPIDPQHNTIDSSTHNFKASERIESALDNKSDRFEGLSPQEASQRYTQELHRVAEKCPEFAPHDDCLITNSMPEYSYKSCPLCQHFELGTCHIYLRERDQK